MTDLQIIDLYWARDESAVRETSGKYGSYCHAIAYAILYSAEDAEECVNDTWLRAWNAMPPSRPNKLSAFLGRITRNLSYDKYSARRAKKRGGGEFPLVLDELEDCVPAAVDVEQAVADAELEERINRFLHTLSERECNVFLARYWYSLPVRDIARRFSMRENTVKTNLFRTRAKLKAFLEEEGILL